MINRLRRRFILIAMTSVTLVMVLLGLSINIVNYLSADSELKDMLQVLSRNQGRLPEFSEGRRPEREPELGAHFTPETPYSTRYFMLRYDDGGTLLDADLRHIAAVTEEEAGAYLTVAQKHGEGFGYTGSYRYYVAADPAGGYTAIFLDCQQQLRSVRTFALVTMLVMAAGIVLIFLLVLVFSKRAIDPVIRNAEKQKQFITDASHELKTPLTVITTSLRVLEMEVGKQKWIDKAQAQADKLRDLVNDLVTLSRLDEEKPALAMAGFDLSEAVRETAESFQDFAAAQGHALELDLAPGLSCRGDEYAIRQLVSILLDNAVKYADSGGSIQVRLERGKKGALLQVSNPCADLAEGELERLFERFYRPDSSRSKQTGGFGVGLSIARSIVQAHKGTIRAERPEPGVIRFTAVLR